MKLVVMGGTGLIGSRLVNKLRENGHHPVAASPETDVNSLTVRGSTKRCGARRSSSTSPTPPTGTATR